MKNKILFLSIFALWINLGIFCPTYAQETKAEEPILVFHNTSLRGWDFSIYIQLTRAHGKDTLYLDYGDGVKVPHFVSDSVFTYLRGTLQQDTLVQHGIVKVYGDSSAMILGLKANGKGIDSVQFLEKCTSLAYLDLGRNAGLKELDLTACHSMQFLILLENPMTALDVTNCPNLEYLDISSTGISNIDLTKNTKLLSLDARSCPISHLDLSNNTELYVASLSDTKIEEFDATLYPNLVTLSLNNTLVKDLDLTQNPELWEVYLNNMPKETFQYGVNLSGNPKLARFFASGNNFTELDFSNNRMLQSIFVSYNNLSELHVDHENFPYLIEMSIMGNRFTWSTIPVLDLGLYFYSNQAPIPIKSSYRKGDTIDLSSQLMCNQIRTEYTWKKGTKYPYVTLRKGIDYEINDGVTTFLKDQDDVVHCEMKNNAINALTISTTATRILPKAGNEGNTLSDAKIFASQQQLNILATGSFLLEVFTTDGRIVYQGDFEDSMSLPLDKGIYIVKLSSQQNRIVKKVNVF